VGLKQEGAGLRRLDHPHEQGALGNGTHLTPQIRPVLDEQKLLSEGAGSCPRSPPSTCTNLGRINAAMIAGSALGLDSWRPSGEASSRIRSATCSSQPLAE